MTQSALFPGFTSKRITTAEGVEVHAVVGGNGPPLLLLHGHPQTHTIWHKVTSGPGVGCRCDARALPRHEPEDVYTRFFSRRACLSFLETQRLCNVDYANEVAFVVWDPETGDGDFVATASYYRDTSTRRAEVAYMIRPDWQGRGLGRVLQDLLFDYGKRHGIESFVAEVLRSNRRMVQQASAACKEVEVEREDDTVIITMTP